jgi:DNA-binding NarL/FixJ family response regulator
LASPLTSPESAAPPARTVVLAGGQALVRAARRSVLAHCGLEVVAEAADAETAAEAAASQRAAVALVDVDVSGGCVAAVRHIVERSPGIAVLVVAPELDEERMLAAVRAGALGFVPETLGAPGLARAVEVALAGEAVIPRAAVSALIEQLRGRAPEQTSLEGLPVQLTRREADVFARLRAGMTPKQIAYELDLSAVTVRRHLSAVARKARQARPVSVALESMS